MVSVDDGLRDRVRKGMEKKGWDQSDLAPKIPVSEAALSNMLTGQTNQIRWLPRLLEVLELEDYDRILSDSLRVLPAEKQALLVELAKSLTGKS